VTFSDRAFVDEGTRDTSTRPIGLDVVMAMMIIP
jgi:hypothetical protein